MKIGELSVASSTKIETIRFYEHEGLLPAPPRSQGNMRLYEAEHLDRLLFIRYCRGLDMSLDEIRVLLSSMDDPTADCGNVDALLGEHIQHVSKRIKELRMLERELKELRLRCNVRRTVDQCGILAGLTEASQDAPSANAGREAHGHMRTIHGR